MKIIKEHFEESNRFIIRTNTYARTLSHINNLVSKAKKDFPSLSDEDIMIIVYAGRHYKGTYGIEFTASTIKDYKHKDYVPTKSLESRF